MFFTCLGWLACFNVVESSMILRRCEAGSLLGPDESVMSISFPALGTPGFLYPPADPHPEDESGAGRSIFFPDEGIYSGHPRLKTNFLLLILKLFFIKSVFSFSP